MHCRCLGITHVVRAIETGDQIEIVAVEVLGSRNFKVRVCQAMRSGVRDRSGDRVRVKVIAREPGVREGLCHQDRRQSVPASDVRDGGSCL